MCGSDEPLQKENREIWAQERRPIILMTNIFYLFYYACLLYMDIYKMVAFKLIEETSISMLTIKLIILILHILMIIVSKYSLRYFAKLIKLQAFWQMLMFMMASLLQLSNQPADMIIILGGLYYLVPICLISSNESW